MQEQLSAPLKPKFMADMITLFRTGQLYQIDMADQALNSAKIPHFLREEMSSGMRIAMPVSPSMGPGAWFVLLVPEEHAEAARVVLSELPFEIGMNPDVWDCQPTEAKRRRWRIYLTIYLLVIFGGILAYCLYGMITDLRR